MALVAVNIACSGSGSGGEEETTARVEAPVETVRLALEPALGGATFSAPLAMFQAPGNTSRFYVVEKGGLVRIATADGIAGTFIDLRSRINTAGEGGLLGMAFHPHFADNGLVFLSFTVPSATSPANLKSFIARAKSNDGGATLDMTSLVGLLAIDQPYTNHNGGNIAFGPDGLLYAGFGDGGSAGDPHGNGQNRNTLLGKMLRLDVDSASPYAIPPTNPFAQGGGRAEIFAWGLRNPWRFSFDRQTGELWAGDVGQDKWEEVDKVVLGGDYGWGKREGNHCFGAASCAVTGLPPIVEYSHAEGRSITGGYVYRGHAIPGLGGSYLYGDFMSGRIWTIPSVGAVTTPNLVLQSNALSSFAEDASGELYVMQYQTGRVLKIIAAR
jgi:glucose/arabinose dehydrogenase